MLREGYRKSNIKDTAHHLRLNIAVFSKKREEKRDGQMEGEGKNRRKENQDINVGGG